MSHDGRTVWSLSNASHNLKMEEIKKFWDAQTESLNRSSDQLFYRKKAEEHLSVIYPEDREIGAIDLGCGAGEMLKFMVGSLRLEAALDASASMLEAARTVMGEAVDMTFVNADIFQYLPTSSHGLWMTTGALNQYLSETESIRFVSMFADHERATSLYLFDCIDPLRYRALGFGISYRSEHMNVAPISVKSRCRRWLLAIRLGRGAFEKYFHYLGSAGMGYGMLPRFWLELANGLNLTVEIVSSRYYEYRYHVILKKRGRHE